MPAKPSATPTEPSATPAAFAPWLKNLRAELKAIATKLARLEAGRLADDSDSGSGSDDDAPRAPADAAAVRRDTEELAARHGRLMQLVHGELLPKLPRSDEALFLAAAGEFIIQRLPNALRLLQQSLLAAPPLPPTPPSSARRERGRRHYFMAAVAIKLLLDPREPPPPKRRAELLTICEAALLDVGDAARSNSGDDERCGPSMLKERRWRPRNLGAEERAGRTLK